MASRGLNVLVVGSGMYVTGAGTTGYGTVLPALCQASGAGLVARVLVAATKPERAGEIDAKAAALQQFLGTALPVEYAPRGSVCDPRAYLRAADERGWDCAIVSVPDDLHFEVTRELLVRDLHVLVVKPFTPKLAEATALVDLAASRHLYGAVEFHKRFDEANLKTRRMLRDDAIGDVLYALVEFSQRHTIPLEHFAEWSARTNIFQYLGVHYVDMVYFSTGARPRRVLASGQKRRLAAAGIDTWDSIQGIIEWEHRGGTFVSTILTNWIDPTGTPAMSDQKIRWIGTQGRIESDQRDRGLSLVTDAGFQLINPYFAEFLPDANDQPRFGGYGARSIEQFLVDVSAIRDGKKAASSLHGLRATFADARVSTAVIEGANLSLQREGEWIVLDPESLEPT